jgi:ABC-type uncharacterized transport system ATPase subunit
MSVLETRATSALLYLDGVHVSFDGFHAINNLSLTLAPGEMRAIIGPNGAGKTTMMDIITGKTKPDEGAVLETIRLKDARNRLAGSLSHGQKQWLEIGMLLAQDPKLLLVDEPVAGMTDVETHQTAELLKEINREKTIMVVEHDMTFVRELGVKVTCLHEGSVLAEGTIDQVSSNERVIEVYLGR